MITLAQARTLFGGAMPPPLDSPPVFEEYVLVSPWPLAVVCAVLGIAACWVLLRLGRGRALAIALLLIGLVLAAGTLIAAGLVETERERVMARTRELVTAAARADFSGVDALLAPDARVVNLGSGEIARPRLMSMVERDLAASGRYALKSHAIGTVRAVIDGPNTARAQVNVTVTPAAFGFATSSWWLLRWRMDAGGVWRITTIEPQQIDGVGALKNLGV
ncbi:hypothetical protein BH11PLA1_BH11PLA1_07850 [soil metagenome]